MAILSTGTNATGEQLRALELEVERDSGEGTVARLRRLADERDTLSPSEALLLRWYEALCEGIGAERSVKVQGSSYRKRLRELIESFGPSVLAVLTIHATLDELLKVEDDDHPEVTPGEAELRDVILAIGYAVEGLVRRDQFRTERASADRQSAPKVRCRPKDAANLGARLLEIFLERTWRPDASDQDFCHKTRTSWVTVEGKPQKRLTSYLWIEPGILHTLSEGPGLAKLCRPIRQPMVVDHQQETGRTSGHVFQNRDGSPWRNNLNERFKACVKAAGIEPHGVSLHSTRYSFATHLLRAGVPVQVVMRLGRWKSVDVLLGIYADTFPSDERDAVERLPYFARRTGLGTDNPTGTVARTLNVA